MGVRAKFKVDAVRSTLNTRLKQEPREDGQPRYWGNKEDTETVEMRSIEMSPVSGNGDPKHENSAFWNATPSGSLTLNTINPEAWGYYELGQEYYLDFTKAD